MNRKVSSSLLLLIIVVGKSQGYGTSGSFSKSFSSSSASSSSASSSFSSSGSFSGSGPIDLIGLKEPLKNGLAGSSSFSSSEAHADSSGASSSSGSSASSGASAGSGASAVSGASSGTGGLPGLFSGSQSLSGAGTLPGVLSHLGSLSGAGSIAGSGSVAGSLSEADSLAGSKSSAGPGSGLLPGLLPYSGSLSGAGSLAGAGSYSGSSSGSGSFGQVPEVGVGHDLNSPSLSPGGIVSQPGYGASFGSGSSAKSSATAGSTSYSGSVTGTGSFPGTGSHPNSLPGSESSTSSGQSYDLSSPKGAVPLSGTSVHSDHGVQQGSSKYGATIGVNKYSSLPNIVKDSTQHGVGYISGSSSQSSSGTYSGGSSATSYKGQFPGPDGSIHDFKPVNPGGGNPTTPSSTVVHIVETPILPIHHGSSQASAGSHSGIQSSTSYKGPFPGPSGSIHDFKPVASPPSSTVVHVVETPTAPIYSSVPTNTYTHTGSKGSGLSYNLIITLPGSKGSIYDSKPATHVGTYFTEEKEGKYDYSTTHGGLPAVTSTLPGSSGNIYQSTPVHTQGHYGTNSDKPAVIGTPTGSEPHVTAEIISILPGKPGSIHDSKPAVGYTTSGGTYSGSSSQGSVFGSGCLGGSCNKPSGGYYNKPSGGYHNKHDGNIKVVVDLVPGVSKPVIPTTSGCYGGICGGVKPTTPVVEICSGPFCKPTGSTGGSLNTYDKVSGHLPVSGCSGISCKVDGGSSSSGYHSGSSSSSYSGTSYNQQTSNSGIDLSSPNCSGGSCHKKSEEPSGIECSGISCLQYINTPANSYSGSQPSLVKPTAPSIDLIAPVVEHGNEPGCSSGKCHTSPCTGSSCEPHTGHQKPSGVSYVEIPICIGSGCSKPSGNTYNKQSVPGCTGSYCSGKNPASGSYPSGTYHKQTPTIGVVATPTTGTTHTPTPGYTSYNQKPSCSGLNCQDKTTGISGSGTDSSSEGEDLSSLIASTYNTPGCSGSSCGTAGIDSSSGAYSYNHKHGSHQGAGVPVHPQDLTGKIDVRVKPTLPTVGYHSGGEVPGYRKNIYSIAGPGTGNLPIDQSPTVSYNNPAGGLYLSPLFGSEAPNFDGFATGNVLIHKSEGTKTHEDLDGSLKGSSSGTDEHSGLSGAQAGSGSNSYSGSFSGSTSGSSSGGNTGFLKGEGSGVQSGDVSGGYSGSGSGASSVSHSSASSGTHTGGQPGGSLEYSGDNSGINAGSSAGANSGSQSSGSFSSASSSSYSGSGSGSQLGGHSGSGSGGYSGSGTGNSGFNLGLGLGIGKGCSGGNCGLPSLEGGLLDFGVNLGGSSSLSGVKGGSGSYSKSSSSSGSGLKALTDLLHPIGIGGAFSESGSFSKSGSLSGSNSFTKSGASSSAYSKSFASSGVAVY